MYKQENLLNEGLTTAQKITALAFSDEDDEGTLFYTVGCQNIDELMGCARVVGSYNSFDAQLMESEMPTLAKYVRYDNAGNPNNGQGLYSFVFGREYSPVIYVGYVGSTDDMILDITTGIFRRYTRNDFISDMEAFATKIDADEHKVFEDESNEDRVSVTYRIWFD